MWRKTLPGYTLIELAIVLIIIGIIAGAILKGQDLLEAAKIRSVLSDISRYRIAVSLYQETYGALPGNDKNASKHFKDVVDGTGNGEIAEKEKDQFWVHLAKSGHITQSEAPTSKLGGVFTVAHNPTGYLGNYLILSGPNLTGLFTPAQAQKIKAKADDGKATEGLLKFAKGKDQAAKKCLTDGGAFDTSHDQPVCILLVSF